MTTNLEARRNGGMSGGAYGHNGFLSDMIGYMSPNWGGLEFWIDYSLDENGDDDGTGGNNSDYSAGVRFKTKMFEVFGASSFNDDRDKDFTVTRQPTECRLHRHQVWWPGETRWQQSVAHHLGPDRNHRRG